jgi:hypothetical protein
MLINEIYNLVNTHKSMMLPLVDEKVPTIEQSRGHMLAQWLRHCATNCKIAGSIPDGVIGIFL